MDKIEAVAEKKSLDPVELYRRNIFKMQPRQIAGHLRRKIRITKKGSMIDGTWSIILSTMLENTTTGGVGGKLVPYLR